MAIIEVEWPAPTQVKACYTTRSEGASTGPYAQFNLATHVGDEPTAVASNRTHLCQTLGLHNEPLWLNQIHSNTVIDARDYVAGVDGDASYSDLPGQVCVVMTADCLPLLICNRQGTEVAAVHAGWRGLAQGAVENTLRRFHAPAAELLVWLGPAIGPAHFEVGGEVREAFCAFDPRAAEAFAAGQAAGKYMADIYRLARQRLQRFGVRDIFGGGLCTYTDAERFYSFRREGTTGRMASLIWVEN